MVIYVKGDATVPNETPVIIAHVCNDVGAWGSGFVIAVGRRWPRAELAYLKWSREQTFKLGRVQFVDVEAGIVVANMIAQRGIGMRAGVPPIRYPELAQCLDEVFEKARLTGASVHMPRIGCGRAGGNWEEVGRLVVGASEKSGVRAVVYDWPRGGVNA